MAYLGKGFDQATFRDMGSSIPGTLPSSSYTGMVNRGGAVFLRNSVGNEIPVSGNIFEAHGAPSSLATNLGINQYQSRQVFTTAVNVGDIAQGNGWYLAIAGTNLTRVSRDTYNWTNGGTLPFSNPGSIAFGNGSFVTHNGTQSSISFDSGVTWSSATTLPGTPSGGLRSRFLNGFFIIFGNGGYMATSQNGTSWTLQTTGTANTLHGIAWSGSVYCAVGGTGGAGTVITSSNLTSWTAQTGSVTNQLWYGIAFGGGVFCTVGESGGIMTSPTGATGAWTTRTSGTASQFAGIVVLGGFFHAFNISGAMRWATLASQGSSWTQVTFTGNPWSYSIKAFDKHLFWADNTTNQVAFFSRSGAGIAFGDSQTGITMTDKDEVGILAQTLSVAQFGATGAIIRGQSNTAKLTSITTSGSLRIGEPIKGFASAANTTTAATVAGYAHNLGTNYGLFMLQATVKFTGTIAANSNIAFAVGLGSSGWAFHTTGTAFRTGENATVFKLEAGAATYTMTTSFPNSISTPMILVQFDATTGFTFFLPGGNITLAGSTLTVCTRIDGSSVSAMTRDTALIGYRIA